MKLLELDELHNESLKKRWKSSGSKKSYQEWIYGLIEITTDLDTMKLVAILFGESKK